MPFSLDYDEVYRLQRLKTFGILDTGAEDAFDAITKAAAHIVRAPIALLNFIDETREWCKSAWGMGRQHASRENSLCAMAVMLGNELVIRNAKEHPEFQDHPQVVGERQVTAYVGIVVKSRDGVALGTLCTIDRRERDLTEGEIHALRTLAASVTELLETRHLEAELADTQRRLENAASSRDEFLAMLAHELRAPLAPIHTAVEILEHPETSKAQRKWSRGILKRHVRHMSKIVDDLLSASLVSIGAIDIRLESTNVATLLEQALETSDTAIKKARHSLSVSVDKAIYAQADATQCPLIITNLILNAATYTAPGGRIHIAVESTEEAVSIAVRDNGAGIAPADIDAIFQLFRQTGRSLARTKGGMGLGLTLARRLAELHGGNLVARSAGLGQGSEFILTLQRATPSETPVNKIPLLPADAGEPLSVLIVDDSRDAADAMGLYFEVIGHDVRVVYSATDALATARARAPDVLLSDIGLPDLNGYELMREIRKLSNASSTLSIAITGYASQADKDAALAAGFDAHVPKPADAGKLEALVNQLYCSKRVLK
ncbi:hybrid sensor histidine kinase/response regulator [Caballeronia sordidicola]|uniref:histidine kinase n=1 Tax=Caballeronia sordidicola TaxID=196367 RepID=A0A242N478_CABSO|nr:ATP-binding protein [Caballeronia sordidicola]OTP78470.1 Chemotaxis protein methyltransferase CheR [Caballeronia sordidicola]